MWFWLYRIKVVNNDTFPSKTEIESGLTVGKNVNEAMQSLGDYYGEDIADILAFRPITETVFSFKEALNETGFNFAIIKKKGR